MKEEWLFPGAMVPVDMETTAALVAEIKRLIDVVGGMALAQSAHDAVLAEREACAKVCEDASGTGKIISCMSAAAAIRARGNT
jgi:hypothetical protein